MIVYTFLLRFQPTLFQIFYMDGMEMDLLETEFGNGFSLHQSMIGLLIYCSA